MISPAFFAQVLRVLKVLRVLRVLVLKVLSDRQPDGLPLRASDGEWRRGRWQVLEDGGVEPFVLVEIDALRYPLSWHHWSFDTVRTFGTVSTFGTLSTLSTLGTI
jgi:hypothetical protein